MLPIAHPYLKGSADAVLVDVCVREWRDHNNTQSKAAQMRCGCARHTIGRKLAQAALPGPTHTTNALALAAQDILRWVWELTNDAADGAGRAATEKQGVERFMVRLVDVRG